MHRKKTALFLTLCLTVQQFCCTASASTSEFVTEDYLAFKEKLEQDFEYAAEHYYDSLYEIESDVDYDGFYVDESYSVSEENFVEEVMDVMDFESAMPYIPYDIPHFDTEEYAPVKENGFTQVSTDPLSTFAADVDTGSYCNLRRLIRERSLGSIPSGSVRTEELLNYFDYTVDSLSEGKFSVQSETAACPWNPDNELLLMTVQANDSHRESAGNSFVYLIDTSGSMDEPYKLLLAKYAFKLLTYTLTENDRVSIVTYAGDSYVALDSCPGNQYDKIAGVLDEITAYGGTNGSGGITAAYDLAEKNYIENGNNRVIIASDGDMNLGITSTSGLVDLISDEKEKGIFLTTLGFGSGNYSDVNMEQIADAGNGNYFYIDCLDEAQHVLIEKQKETLLTTAKDVKFQAEFNPAKVSAYRLIGYENRAVADDDFQNDQVDGGEVGAGQQITVLYELVPATDQPASDSGLKYQRNRELTEAAGGDDILTLSINYKEPDDAGSVTEEYTVSHTDNAVPSSDMHLAVSLAEFAMFLHDSAFAEIDTASILEHADAAAKGSDDMYRIQYALLVHDAINNK